MPVYEYRCAVCGSIFERVTSFDDHTEAVCPNGHREAQRIYSAPTIIFKGSGFYVTDHRSSGSSGSSNH
jgi:putative FmdB family regulatory protein